MTTRSLSPLGATAFLLAWTSLNLALQAGDRLTQAWESLPTHFQNGVVKVSADNATATSQYWYFIAKKPEGKLYSITIADGQIIQEKPSLDLRELLAHPTPIDFSRIQAGSGAAWAAAENFARQAGRTLGTVSYVLTQDGPTAAPIWSIWCYSPDGSYFGMLKVLATDGTILSTHAY